MSGLSILPTRSKPQHRCQADERQAQDQASTPGRPLTAAQIGAVASAFPRLLRIRVLLAVHGIAGTHRRLHRRHRVSVARPGTGFDPTLWQARSLALRRAAARIPGTHCLARSLALWHWLGQAGIAAELRIGVRIDNGVSHAHAWVEHDGAAIDEQTDVNQRFTPVAWSAAAKVLAANGRETP
ncbi:MAG: lasso peptide biosynthesis B2 protein [Xanthomonadales bacterium]|nr:lasso peptide biosynthesis B2 protein [Xanthomonadales bacterium]